MDNDFINKIVHPDISLSDYLDWFWMMENRSSEDKDVVVIPDGRIDIIFTQSPDEPFGIGLIGLETLPSRHIFSAGTTMFGVSLKLLAAEYLIDTNIAELVNSIKILPNNFWGITEKDLSDFNAFCKKVIDRVSGLINPDIDERKKKLFDLIYSSNGSLTVKEISEKVFWSSRQINRYFNQKFGLSLKTFCNILRFRASFPHIKEGKLFPEQNFSDQPHFIKEVKKLAGVTPKELFKNQNDRFLQFSLLPEK